MYIHTGIKIKTKQYVLGLRIGKPFTFGVSKQVVANSKTYSLDLYLVGLYFVINTIVPVVVPVVTTTATITA